MALVNCGLFTWPPAFMTSGINTFVIDALGEMLAVVTAAPKDGNLRKFIFNIQSITTAQDLKCSFQNVDASGDPDGTADQSVVIPLASLAGGSAFNTADMGAGSVRAVVAGELFAGVIEFNTVGGNISLMAMGTGQWGSSYVDHKTAAYSKSTARQPIMAFEYDDGSYAEILGCYPVRAAAAAFGTGSAADERALRFSVPFRCRVVGLLWYGIGTGDHSCNLYSGTTLLASSGTRDKDTTVGTLLQAIRFTTPYIVEANTVYRGSVLPTSATTLTLYNLLAPSNAALGQLPGGAALYLSTRADAGAWTDVTTERPTISLIIDQIDTGGGPAPTPIVARGHHFPVY